MESGLSAEHDRVSGVEQSGEPRRGGRRVLVCDDTEQIRRLIRVNLELEGYEVDRADQAAHPGQPRARGL